MLTGVINLRWLRTLEAALQRCFAAAALSLVQIKPRQPEIILPQ
jgi:hypothetical protein